MKNAEALSKKTEKYADQIVQMLTKEDYTELDKWKKFILTETDLMKQRLLNRLRKEHFNTVVTYHTIVREIFEKLDHGELCKSYNETIIGRLKTATDKVSDAILHKVDDTILDEKHWTLEVRRQRSKEAQESAYAEAVYQLGVFVENEHTYFKTLKQPSSDQDCCQVFSDLTIFARFKMSLKKVNLTQLGWQYETISGHYVFYNQKVIVANQSSDYGIEKSKLMTIIRNYSVKHDLRQFGDNWLEPKLKTEFWLPVYYWLIPKETYEYCTQQGIQLAVWLPFRRALGECTT